jgi:hypothetical protein
MYIYIFHGFLFCFVFASFNFVKFLSFSFLLFCWFSWFIFDLIVLDCSFHFPLLVKTIQSIKILNIKVTLIVLWYYYLIAFSLNYCFWFDWINDATVFDVCFLYMIVNLMLFVDDYYYYLQFQIIRFERLY